nr:hypothetical protein [Brevundimonas diminuta]
MTQTSMIERALELADSGNFRVPSEVRRALLREGYTQSDVFGLEGKATWQQLRQRCGSAAKQKADNHS